MKGIYLCAKRHRIFGYDIDYNDIDTYDGINVLCDARQINIDDYDFVIATPPCNWYSKANYRRNVSKVALETKDILPLILKKLEKYNRPFIVENVVNATLLPKSKFWTFTWGNHTFYTNTFFFLPDKKEAIKQNKVNKGYGYRDGNENVDIIIRLFLKTIHGELYD